jgi:hypothetical protein
MSIIKEVIKSNNLDVNIRFTLGSGVGLSGYQQEIDNFTINKGIELINPIVDSEVRKFNYNPTIGTIYLNYYFNDTRSFKQAGFTDDEIQTSSVKLLNSFFILNFYDTFNTNTQRKIFSSYLTKVLSGVNNTPKYQISSNIINQFYNWYVPLSFINSQTGSTIIGYTNFSFYNAKFGKVTLFFNKDNENILTPEKMYFKTELDLINKTWRFLGLPTNNANAYEISSTSAYVTRINNTIGNFVNTKQTYPTGNTFQTTTGTYVTE